MVEDEREGRESRISCGFHKEDRELSMRMEKHGLQDDDGTI